MSREDLLRALRATLERDPRNGPLWLHYAELLEAEQRPDEAIAALRTATELPEARDAAMLRLVRLLRERGELAEALIRAEAALERREDPELRRELELVLAARGLEAPTAEEQAEGPAERPRLAARAGERLDDDEWAEQFDWGDLRVTFADVQGLEDVKRQVRLRIIAPFQQPEIYQAFGRAAGGGLLLYGPPGCGKTFLARAIAGELGARFAAVSIHEILDKYYGETERLIHGLFEQARRTAPAVLFFDEFDALGSSRGRSESQFWKTMVNALLAEMDGVGRRNTDVLVCAATNLPWNVDVAFRRPGRFDRILFVPPPDDEARTGILQAHLHRLPGGSEIQVEPLVARTELFSGADLKALCERAAERAIDRSLQSGRVHRVEARDVQRALAETRSSILEWFATARNHVRYSNEGGQLDELAAYLKQIKRL